MWEFSYSALSGHISYPTVWGEAWLPQGIPRFTRPCTVTHSAPTLGLESPFHPSFLLLLSWLTLPPPRRPTDTRQDLNVDPTLPFCDESFDVVTCVVSVDYLIRPLEVFAEIARVLKPGGTCIMSMSNRCFPTKAVSIWLETGDAGHVFIVGAYFRYGSPLFEPPTAVDISPNPGRSDPMFIVQAAKKKEATSG